MGAIRSLFIFIGGVVALLLVIPQLHLVEEERLATPFALLWIMLAAIVLSAYLHAGLQVERSRPQEQLESWQSIRHGEEGN